MRVKRLTFARRASEVSAGEFASRWRADALTTRDTAPAGVGPQRLVHCIVRPGRTDRPFHGVAMEWFDDEGAMAAHDEHARTVPGAAVLDGASMVRARVRDRVVFGEDLLEQWWSTAPTDPRLLLLGIIERKPGTTRTEFAHYWWHRHRPLANRLLPPEVQPPIYVHDYVQPDEACPWDGIGEFYDVSVDVARQRTHWAEGDDAAAIVADEEQFLVRESRYALITDASVVIGRPSP